MKWYLFEALHQVTEFIAYLIPLYFFMNARLTKDKKCYLKTILFVVAVSLLIGPHHHHDVVRVLADIVVMFVALAFVIEEPWRTKWMCIVGAYMMTGAVSICVSMITKLLIVQKSHTIHSQIFISMLLLMLIGKLKSVLSKKYPKLYERIYQTTIRCIFFAFITIGILLMNIRFRRKFAFEKNEEMTFFALVMIAILAITIMLILHLKNRTESFREKIRFYERYVKIQKQYVEGIHNHYKELRSFKHDVKHHMGCLSMLLEDGNVDKAQEYIQQFLEEADGRYRLEQQCPNAIVNAILHRYVQIFDTNHIEFHFHYNIYSEMKIEDYDLSTILCNLLQNAIEANEKLEKEKREISLSMVEDHAKIILKVTNRIKSEEMLMKNVEDKKTSKEDKQNHGFGLMNIERTVEKYNGYIHYEKQKDYFECIALLPCIKE